MTFNRWGTRIPLAAVALAGAACGLRRAHPLASRDGVQIEAAYAHPSAGDVAAAYFRIANRGATTDTLQTVINAGGGNAMVMNTVGGRMAPMGSLVLAPGSAVVMAPGGIHVMFGGLTRDWSIGDTIHLTLRFARVGELAVAVPVLPFGEIP
ncbi:MAG TPA: copper chaperone PCu(A)C [Gemmatimonadales bacterium]|nr:copper chaperone PCu(A)C [Gemmatimonadales bacterium]